MVLGTHIPRYGSASGTCRHDWVNQGRPYPGFRRIAGVDVVPPSVLIGTLVAAAAGMRATVPSMMSGLTAWLTSTSHGRSRCSTDGETVTISRQRHYRRRCRTALDRQRDGPSLANRDSVWRRIDAGSDGAAALDPASIDELMSGWGVEGRAFPVVRRFVRETPGRLRAEVVLGADAGCPGDCRTAGRGDGPGPSGRTVRGLMLPVAADRVHICAEAPPNRAGWSTSGVTAVSTTISSSTS